MVSGVSKKHSGAFFLKEHYLSKFSCCILDAPLIHVFPQFIEFAGWLIHNESEMPALHLSSQRGQRNACLCLSRLSFLMEGKLCLTRCEGSSAQRHSETSCCLFLTNRDIPTVWPGQIYDVPPARMDNPCPHSVSFVCLGPASFVIAILLAGTFSIQALLIHFWLTFFKVSFCKEVTAYLSKGRTGILNTGSAHYS